MLNLLLIRNFALIQNMELEPAPGFTVLTGETGAGKSIVLSALNLLLGAKAAAEIIRQGEDQAQVEALFVPPAGWPWRDEPDMASELVLKRVVSREGRNRVQINGGLSTLGNLAQYSTSLVSLCGQHEQQSLLNPEEHLLLLDAFAGLTAARQEVGRLVRAVADIDRQIKELAQQQARRAEREAWLRQTIKELEEAKPDIGEEEALKGEHRLLANAEQRADLSRDAYNSLYGAEKGSALSNIGKALVRTRQLAELDPALSNLNRALEDSYYNLEDAAHQLRDYQARVAGQPERLNWIEERLSLLQRLARRYGGSVEQALIALDSAKKELDSLESGQERFGQMQKARGRALDAALAAARGLSRARAAAAPDFADKVEKELADLGMSACKFQVRLAPPAAAGSLDSSDGPLNSRGLEGAEFYMAPNPGEGFRHLARIASGGELSRLLLALRGLTAREMGSPTLIFDEVDAGIGGDVGLTVGRKLAKLADSAQIICITHLPQIAAFAGRHFQVSKQVSHGRTSTHLNRLEGEARLRELARMLGAGASARAHAEELLKIASI